MKSRIYTTPEIAKLMGDTFNKVQGSYINQNLVIPSVQAADGTGTKRLWSYRNVVEFFTAKALKEMGWKPEAIRAILAKAKEKAVECGEPHESIWQEGRMWVFEGSPENLRIVFENYDEETPTLEEDPIGDLDFDTFPMKAILVMDAVHRHVQFHIREAGLV